MRRIGFDRVRQACVDLLAVGIARRITAGVADQCQPRDHTGPIQKRTARLVTSAEDIDAARDDDKDTDMLQEEAVPAGEAVRG